MATLEATKNRVDAFITSIQTHLDNYQTVPYWQGLSTHAQRPQHTTAADDDNVPDQLAQAPSDQPVSWDAADFIPRPVSTWPCELRVDVYDGPNGVGYTLSATFEHDGDVWEKTTNVGPETFRTKDWTLMENDYVI